MTTPVTTSTRPSARQPREDTVSLAYERLRADILTGHLRPGAVMSQVQLATSLRTSRGPVREALRRLIAEGLVVGDFNRQMRVSALDLDDFDQIYAMRIALEPVAVSATVPTLSEDARARLREDVEAMDEAIQAHDAEAFRDRHRAFHLGLTAGAGERVRGVLADLWDHSERYRLSYLHSDDARAASATALRLAVSQVEHQEILAAVLAGDPTRCSDALVGHLRRTLEVVFAEAREVPRIRLANDALAARPGHVLAGGT